MAQLPRHIEYRPLDKIKPAVRNAKKHDPLIGDAIERLGFLDPMIEDGRTGRLIAGHGRLDQLKAQCETGQDAPDGIQVRDGKWWAPVTIGWSSESDAQAEDANITLNRLTERGGWDDTILVAMLGDQPDPGLLGFGDDELAALLADDDGVPGDGSAALVDPDEVPDDAPAITKPGDVWVLGPHRIMAGDCREAGDVQILLDGAAVNLAFTSPPYAEQREYDPTSGFKPIKPDEYVEWFAPVAANVAEHLAGDGSWFVNIKAASRGLDTETYVPGWPIPAMCSVRSRAMSQETVRPWGTLRCFRLRFLRGSSRRTATRVTRSTTRSLGRGPRSWRLTLRAGWGSGWRSARSTWILRASGFSG